MALKWVQAIKQITRTGTAGSGRKVYYPGDWFQARNMEIKQRLANNEIAIYDNSGDANIFEPEECGIVSAVPNLNLAKLGASANSLSISYNLEPMIPYLYTFYYTGGKFREEMLPIAFDLLKKWEMAVPIESFDILAETIGSVKQRNHTLKIIGDLRVPVYDVRQMYFRKCDATIALTEAWKEEQMLTMEDGVLGEPRLAFLRALYLHPLLILALPPTWREGVKTE